MMSKFINVFIGFVFVVLVCYWIMLGVFVFTGLNTVSEVGLKGLVEKVWCGQDETCKLPGAMQ